MNELYGLFLVTLAFGIGMGYILRSIVDQYRADKLEDRNWKALNRRSRWVR